MCRCAAHCKLLWGSGDVADGALPVGLLMFGLAFAFTMGLASFLQQTALTRQQAAVPAQIELPVVSMPSGSYYRKASF